jgi:hypothetical protein
MFELPILARQARDLVEAQFSAAEQPRGPAARTTRGARRAGAPAPARVRLRVVSARVLRALADRLEPRADARPRSA